MSYPRGDDDDVDEVPLLPLSRRFSTTSVLQFDIGLKRVMKDDVSVTMRNRALAGYSMDCASNVILENIPDDLKSMWAWAKNAERLAKDGISNGLNFAFQGVYNIWFSSVPLDISESKTSSRPPRGESGYLASVTNLLAKLQLRPFTSTPSQTAQRQLALITCGWGLPL